MFFFVHFVLLHGYPSKRTLALIVITKTHLLSLSDSCISSVSIPSETAIPVINSVLYFFSCFVVALPFVLRYLSLYHPRDVPGSHKIEGRVFILLEYFQHRKGKKALQAKETMSTTHPVCFPRREQQLRIPRVTPSSANRQGLRPLRAYAVVGAEVVD